MAIKYYRLLDLLNRKGIKKTELIARADISSATLAKLSNHEYVSMEVIDKICKALDCQPQDLIEYVNENKDE